MKRRRKNQETMQKFLSELKQKGVCISNEWNQYSAGGHGIGKAVNRLDRAIGYMVGIDLSQQLAVSHTKK